MKFGECVDRGVFMMQDSCMPFGILRSTPAATRIRGIERLLAVIGK
ncbi:hypothetical protein C7S17_5794 [Burkholderia thailandensis]|nr:hypothetical protein [Burkholderia thailandensis]